MTSYAAMTYETMTSDTRSYEKSLTIGTHVRGR